LLDALVEFLVGAAEVGEEAADFVLMVAGAEGGADDADEGDGAEGFFDEGEVGAAIEEAEDVVNFLGGFAGSGEEDDGEIGPAGLAGEEIKEGGEGFGIESFLGDKERAGGIGDAGAKVGHGGAHFGAETDLAQDFDGVAGVVTGRSEDEDGGVRTILVCAGHRGT
jgi:hypothetical protein